jgi:C1A family cysteine protease
MDYYYCVESEFKQYVGKVWDQNANKGMKKAAIPHMASLPKSFDWREHGAVTEVKNQVRSSSAQSQRLMIINHKS